MLKVHNVLKENILALTPEERARKPLKIIATIVCPICGKTVFIENYDGTSKLHQFDYIMKHHTDFNCDILCSSSEKQLDILS